MIISNHFNRFYRALVKDAHIQLVAQTDLVITVEKFTDSLKFANMDYPLNADKTDFISVAHIGNKEMLQHVEFIVAWMGERGMSPQFVEDDWERILADADINHRN